MEFGPFSTHVTLSFWALVLATLLACGLAVPFGSAFANLRPRGVLTRLLVVVLGFVGLIFLSQLPFLLVHLTLLWRPESSGPVTFCFGDPHANMLVGFLVPPTAGTCAYFRRSRALARNRLRAPTPIDPNT